MNFDSLQNWISNYERPFLVAGPCSAENEEQLHTIATQLATQKVDLFRAGIWKPRTRPGSFEGVGVKGIQWLGNIKRDFGFRVTCEVANAFHVETCLANGIDVLWIGARTSVNPFTVQEIAEAIRGTGIPVMIKNPVSPDINLWQGAIERIVTSGSEKVIAIHRGFSSFEKSKYRNQPMWEIPIELKRRIPAIPMICDPSHICGNRTGLQTVAQKAMDLNFDGLMIETHHEPDQALSDRQQQVTPSRLKELVGSLILRHAISDNELFNISLEELRELIDKQDSELIKLLKDRMDLIERIGEFKRENNITILQPERWNEIVTSRTDWASEIDLSAEFILRVFQQVHQESIRKQMEVFELKEENGKM